MDDDLKKLAETARDRFVTGFGQLSAAAKKKAFFVALSQFTGLVKKIEYSLRAELGQIVILAQMPGEYKIWELLKESLVCDFRKSAEIIRYILYVESTSNGVYQIDRDRLVPLLRLHDEVYTALQPYWNANKEEVNRTDEHAREVMVNTVLLGPLLK